MDPNSGPNWAVIIVGGAAITLTVIWQVTGLIEEFRNARIERLEQQHDRREARLQAEQARAARQVRRARLAREAEERTAHRARQVQQQVAAAYPERRSGGAPRRPARLPAPRSRVPVPGSAHGYPAGLLSEEFDGLGYEERERFAA